MPFPPPHPAFGHLLPQAGEGCVSRGGYVMERAARIAPARLICAASRILAFDPYRTVWYVCGVLPRTTDAWKLPLGHPGPASRGREQHE